MKAALPLLLLLCFAISSFSQDIIYTTNGDKTEVKILEIKPGEIRYKKHSNPDGPDYVASKSDVLLITYSNGTFESFGARSTVVNEVQPLTTTYGKNYIAYNTFDLILTNITFSYERTIAKGLLGIRVPVKVGFGNTNVYGSWYNNSNISSGTIMATGLDINIYPNRQGRMRYFIAPSFLVTSFNYTTNDYDNYYNSYETKMGIQYAILVKHGLLMQITPHFNMSCVIGLGLSQNETDYEDNTNSKVTLEFNVGYKF